MGVKQVLRSKIKSIDLISIPPSLRVRGDSSVQTVFGGGLSLVIIVALSVIFFQSLVSVAKKINISYSQQFQDDPDSEVDITTLQFAVGIDSQDFSAAPLKFQVNLIQNSFSIQGNGPPTQTQTPIFLSSCNVSDWKNVGTHFQDQFNGFGMDKMFCLNPSQAVSLYGYDGSFPYRFLTLQIRMCNITVPGCDSIQNVVQMMGTHIESSSLYRVRLFIVNTLFSPANQVPTSKVIQKNLLLSFTSTTATVGYIYIGDYTIDTDQSVFPVAQYQQVTGSYIDTSTSTTIPITGTSNFLINFNFYKSTKSLTVSRSFGKIDDLLSYIGGLFSLIISVISILFSSYNSNCYELAVAQSSFILDKKGRKYREKDFTFLTHIKFTVYEWFSCFGCRFDWQNMEQIAELKEEVQNQLDINIILRRIRHLEAVSKILMKQHKYISLYLANPPTLEQYRLMKEMITYYDQLLERLEANEPQQEFPRLSLKQIASEKSQNGIQDFDLGNIGMQKAKSSIFNNSDTDRLFLSALVKLRSDKDYKLVKQLILKQALEQMPPQLTELVRIEEQNGTQFSSGLFQKNQLIDQSLQM